MTLSGESENGAKNNSVEWRKRERERQTDRQRGEDVAKNVI